MRAAQRFQSLRREDDSTHDGINENYVKNTGAWCISITHNPDLFDILKLNCLVSLVMLNASENKSRYDTWNRIEGAQSWK